jgi:toxin ParE1/3/4
MARYRLSEPAKADIAAILRRSEALHGSEARIRYRACLTAAVRRVAADPEGRSTVDLPSRKRSRSGAQDTSRTNCFGFAQAGRAEIAPGIRSFHIRHSRDESSEAPVANPVHVIFYRVIQPGVVEIIRVLHDRMEPRLHIGREAESDERRRKD